MEYRYLSPKQPPPFIEEEQFGFSPDLSKSSKSLGMTLYSRNCQELVRNSEEYVGRMKKAAD
jgi:hypothetical protein